MTQTINERVLVAVQKMLELMALMAGARGEVLMAKAAADEVRLSNPTKDTEAMIAQVLKTTEESTLAEFKQAETWAAAPLAAAQSEYNREVAAAGEKRNNELQRVTEEGKQKLAEITRNQEIRAATAQAEIHTAQQKVAQLQATMDQYRRQTQEQLGIDLNALVVAFKD